MAIEVNMLTVGPVRITVFRVEEEGEESQLFLKVIYGKSEPTWFRLTEGGPVLVTKVAPWTPQVVEGGKE